MAKGGARPGAGRKPKADELKLIERLSPMADDAYKALHNGVKSKNPMFVKLWMEYMHGKPSQRIETQQLDENGNPMRPEPNKIIIAPPK
jgi:hypothetical protein